MAGEKSVRLNILGDNSDAKIKIAAIDDAAKRLALEHPELQIGISTAAAQEQLSILRGELKAVGDEAAAAEEKAGLFAREGALGAASLEKAWGVAKYAILGAGVAIGVGVVQAAKFDQALTRVHTQAGVSTATLNSMRSGVLALAGQVGENPDSLAESLYHVASNMASMGATGPQMLNAVKVAAEGARVGGADLVDVTNALGAAIASGIPGVQNYESAMGMLNATVGAGDMKMQDLSEALGTGFLSNVKIYGSTLNDVGAILATFGDNNIRGAMAGTQLRMSVQSISVQAKSAGPALKELGLQVGELGRYQAIHGTVATINLLVQRMHAAGISAHQEGQIITELFGKKAGAGVAVLVDQVDRLNSKSKVLAQGAKGFGTAWSEQQKTVSQQFADLKQGSDALVISLGSALLPTALKVVTGLNHLVQWLQKNAAVAGTLAAVVGTLLAGIALAKLEHGLKGAVEGFEGLFKAGGKVIGFVGQMAAKMGIMTVATEAEGAAAGEAAVAQEGLNLAFLMSPIGLIVIGIAALVTAFVLLWTHSAAFRNFWIGLWHDIEAVARDVWSFLKGAFGEAEQLFKPVIRGVEAVVGAFERIKNFVTSSFDGWWKQNGEEIKEVWHVVWAVISDWFRVNWLIVTTIAKAGWQVLTAAFQLGRTIIVGEWKLMWTIVSTEFKIAWTVVSTIAQAGWIILRSLFSLGMAAVETAWKVGWAIISAVFKTAWDAVAAVAKITWDVIVGIFTVALDLVTGKWGKAWAQVETTAKQVWGAITTFLGQAMGNMKSAVSAGINAVVSFFSSLPGRAMSALGSMGSLLFNAGRAILEGFLQGLKSAWNDVTSFVGGIGSWIASHKGPIEVDAVLLRPHGRAIMGGLVGGLQDGMPGLASQLARTTSVISNAPVASGLGVSAGAAGKLEAEWVGGQGGDAEFINWLKKNIRIRGGDPGVLGR